MREKFRKVIRIVIGLFISSIGLVFTFKSNIGAAPWEVLSLGVANIAKVSVGKITVIISAVVLFIDFLLGQKVGLGSLLDMFLIGTYIDILLDLNIISNPNSTLESIIYIFLAMVFMGIGSYFYMSAEMGSGPRDSFVVGLVQKTGRSFGLIRSMVEIAIVIVGYLLGAKVGIGTIILSLFTGIVIEKIFELFKFDVSKLDHKSLVDEINFLKLYMDSI